MIAPPSPVALLTGLDVLAELLGALEALKTEVAGTTAVDRTVEVEGVAGGCAVVGDVVGETSAGVGVDVDSVAILFCRAA